MVRMRMIGARMGRPRKVEDGMLATCRLGQARQGGASKPATSNQQSANQGMWVSGDLQRGMTPN